MNSVELVDQVRRILSQIDFMGYEFDVRHGHGGVFIQATHWDADTYGGCQEKQYTRKWLVSPHATNSEIVQTVFKCCLTSMEHRAREAFQYRGARIFGPHFDVEDLVLICKAGLESAGAREGARVEALESGDAR